MSYRRSLLRGPIVWGAALSLLALACEAGSNTGGGVPSGGGGGAGAGSSQGAGSVGGESSDGGSTFATGGQGTGGGVITCTPMGPDDDVDGDGFTPNQGDCEDCDPNRNPNAIEAPTKEGEKPFDEDCDDQIDEVEDPVICDQSIEVDEMDPFMSFAAIGLCKESTGAQDWGFVNAAWVMADGAAPPSDPPEAPKFHRGHGFVPDFGPNVDVREGESMLILSSGTARRPIDPGYSNVNGYDKQIFGSFAMGFPKESPSCPGTTTGVVRDAAGVELTIRTPANATGISFDFNFYTFEWPGYVCSTFNDFFIAILDPIPEGQTDGNISFDQLGNPVSVNNALLQVCGCEGNPPNNCQAGPISFPCPLGNIDLIGTGFGFDSGEFAENHGATGWLRTVAPVPGGAEIKLRYAVHDSGDGALDSSTLVDNFQWVLEPGTQVGTNPIPQ
jgi:hypothetical protein